MNQRIVDCNVMYVGCLISPGETLN